MEELERLFEESGQKVLECQKGRLIDSCLKCPEVLECKERKDYVRNTYRFLNGGQEEGGFDF
ncbi:hypothetical protein [Helicobacter pametensis]|uniref:hypothetical protein n=1 Tax=Helicobacter pametensis TaxID=95149 RepID=UPI000484BF74|nr:hypothetical protein [Helicobacter pametensis]